MFYRSSREEFLKTIRYFFFAAHSIFIFSLLVVILLIYWFHRKTIKTVLHIVMETERFPLYKYYVLYKFHTGFLAIEAIVLTSVV